MIRYERHTTVLDNIKRIEDVSREDIETALFMRRINKMEKAALGEIDRLIYTAKAKYEQKPTHPNDLFGKLYERAQARAQASGLGAFQFMQGPYANGQAGQQIPRNYLGLLGGLPW